MTPSLKTRSMRPNVRSVPRLWIPIVIASALFFAHGRAHAQLGRLYIKHTGTPAVAIDGAGNLFNRGRRDVMPPGGLQIKRNGTVMINFGAKDPNDPERLGVFGNGFLVTEFSTVPSGQAGSLLFKNAGTTMTEITASGTPLLRRRSVDMFGYRRDFRALADVSITNFINVINFLDGQLNPGTFGVSNPPGNGYNAMGAVSMWDKGAQMHDIMFPDIHGGPTFLPWHRHMMNWMEDLMRARDPLVTLPYWNWESNPVLDSPPIAGPSGPLGAHTGRLGSPFQTLDNNNVLAGSWEEFCDINNPMGYDLDSRCNPAKPPQTLDRFIKFTISPIDFGIVPDGDIIFLDSWESMRQALEENAHNNAHGYLCDHGELSHGRAPMDAMFWLLHTNCDRVWSVWQQFGPGRNTTTGAYGTEDDDQSSPLNGNIEPWSSGLTPTGFRLRPWTAPDNKQAPISYKDPSILNSRLYE